MTILAMATGAPASETSKVIAGNVRAIRQQRGLRQADLADAVGGSLSRLALSNCETGTRNFKVEELAGLCRVLGVSLAELMDGDAECHVLFPSGVPAGASPTTKALAAALWPEFEKKIETAVKDVLRGV